MPKGKSRHVAATLRKPLPEATVDQGVAMERAPEKVRKAFEKTQPTVKTGKLMRAFQTAGPTLKNEDMQKGES